jgi:hypothetical protein
MTIQKKTLIASAITIWCILALQGAASVWSLYWVFPWFDMLMHFLGGMWLALTIFALMSKHLAYLAKHPIFMLVALLGGTLFFGFLWEVMEFFIDLILGTDYFQPNLPDTLSDLTFDLLGGLVSFIITRIFVYHHTHDIISEK